jgi:hypothetical protein
MNNNKMTLNELLTEIIKGISSKINKKALNEILSGPGCTDLNEYLFKYYNRVHGIKLQSNLSYEFISMLDADDEKEFNEYIKENYNARIYKQQYNYNCLEPYPIKFKYTGLVIGYNNGFTRWAQWAFDVNQYVKHQQIIVIQ